MNKEKEELSKVEILKEQEEKDKKENVSYAKLDIRVLDEDDGYHD